MKKFVVLSFVAILILAFGATVYGQEKAPTLQFTPFGFIDAQTLYYVNVTGANPAAGIYNAWGAPSFDAAGKPSGTLNRKLAYLESRARLGFNAAMGKEVSGTILFEMDSAQWGDTPGGSLNKVSERNTYGYWAADRAAVEIKSVYIDFGVPVIPVPITMRVGLQGLGFRPLMLMSTDGMGISAGIKLDPVLIAPFWAKALEGANQTADDVDVYGLRVEAAVSTVKVGGYGLYFNSNSYPHFVTPAVTAFPIGAPVYGTNSADMWWLGFYTDGKLGPVNLNFDFVYDNGKVKAKAGGVPDVKYSGYAARIAVDYPWEALNFGFVGAYGSGADTTKTSATGLPGSATSTGVNSTKVGSYVIPTGSETGAAFGESIVFYSTWVNRGDSGIANSLNYNQMCRGNLGGTWFAKVYAGFKIVPEFKLTGQVLYIGDTTKSGNTFGTARSGADLRNDSSIGWEGDLIAELQIYKNLKFTAAGGYLLAGKALDLYSGVAAVGNHSPDDPWQITTNLTYSF